MVCYLEHYGINVMAELLLDYIAIQINSGEFYRQFFDRQTRCVFGSSKNIDVSNYNQLSQQENPSHTREKHTIGRLY